MCGGGWVLRDWLGQLEGRRRPPSFADLALVHRNPGCMRRGRAPWATLGTGWSLAAPFIQSLWTPLPEPLAGVRPEGRDPKNIWVYDRNIFFYGRSISPHSRRGPFYPAFSGGLSSHFIPQTKKTGTFGLKPVRMREWAACSDQGGLQTGTQKAPPTSPLG